MTRTPIREYRPQATNWSLPRFLLKRWLKGRWALVFSHPDDFATYGFEADRWVSQVKAAFEADSIAALAIDTRAPGGDTSWITAVGGCVISSRTFDSIVERRPRRRFVMVLDESLQLRRTFLYARAEQVPSPLGLACWARARLGRDPHS